MQIRAPSLPVASSLLLGFYSVLIKPVVLPTPSPEGR